MSQPTTTTTPLRGAQRKFLRGLAHGLKPLVHVGRGGLTAACLASVEEALASHELIKVKFLDHKDRKEAIGEQIVERLDCQPVGAIGHVSIFYRPAREPARRRIALPD